MFSNILFPICQGIIGIGGAWMIDAQGSVGLTEIPPCGFLAGIVAATFIITAPAKPVVKISHEERKNSERPPRILCLYLET